MDDSWLDETGKLLGAGFPLPLDAPFTSAQARDCGVSRRSFERLLRTGMLRCELRGVYAAAQAPNDPLMRARRAGSGAPAGRGGRRPHGGLAPRRRRAAAQRHPSAASTGRRPRDRHPHGARGGRRTSSRSPSRRTSPMVHGIPVTTPLRTALDCGRLLWRFDALAVIDGFVRLGVPQEQMMLRDGSVQGLPRRHPAALPGVHRRWSCRVGAGVALRLHWYDAGLGRPEVQCGCTTTTALPLYRIDIA